MDDFKPIAGCVFGYPSEPEAIAAILAEIASDQAEYGVELDTYWTEEYEPGLWQAQANYLEEDVAAPSAPPAFISTADAGDGSIVLLLALAVGAIFLL